MLSVLRNTVQTLLGLVIVSRWIFLRCLLQFLFPNASEPACSGEGRKSHGWQGEAETARTQSGFICVIEWAGTTINEHNSSPLKGSRGHSWHIPTLEHCALVTGASPRISLSQSELVRVTTAQIPVQSLVGYLITWHVLFTQARQRQ